MKRIIISTLIVSIAFVAVVGQNVQQQNTTVDKSRRLDVKVDPTTLAMNFEIPLGVYPGRAGNSVPQSIRYNSKVWKMEYGGYYQGGPCCAPSFTANPQGLPTENNYSWVGVSYADDSASGWNVRNIFPSLMGEALGIYDYNGYPAGIENPDADYFVDRLRLKMPDGSTHEFRKDDRVYYLPPTVSYPISYFSVDSTAMKYVVESATNATLYLPNGSRYKWTSTGTELIDASGNKIIASSDISDSMGRQIPNLQMAAGQPNDQVHNMHGIGAAPRSYTLKWRYMKNTQTGETVLSNPSQTLRSLGDSDPTGPFPNVIPLFDSGGASRVTPPNTFNPVLLAEVQLPDNNKYQFRYNIYGEIDKIIYPTGAYERFEYSMIDNIDPLNEPYAQTNRGVTKRWVSESGLGNDEVLTQYSVQSVTPYVTRVTNVDGSFIDRVIQKGRGPGELLYGFDNATTGSVLEERAYSTTGQMISRTLNSYIMEGPRGSMAHATATRDARLERSISIIIEPNNSTALMTMRSNEYDTHADPEYFAYLNVKRVKEYGFVTVSKTTAENVNSTLSAFAGYFNSQAPISISETDYSYDPNYKARGITSRPIEIRVLDPANPTGPPLAKTQMVYDESSYLLADSGALTGNAAGTWVNPGTNIRGLVTTQRVWNSDTNSWIETHTQYDQYGNIRKVFDPIGNVTETVYSTTYACAYPTQVITPAPDPNNTGHGSNTAFTTSTVYDFNTGLPTSTTDINGQTTNIQYNDPLLRPTKATAPNGQQTITEYGAGTTASTRFVKTKTQVDETNWKEGYTWYDGLGRTIKTQSVDNAGDVFALTCYDNMSRVAKVSNPFRGLTNQDCSTANGTSDIYWTTNTFDSAGRPWKVTTPDNAVIETTYDLATSGSHIGTVTTVKDQAQKERRSVTNALGQLVRVDEPDATSGHLGSVTAPNQPTSYAYDTLNNLTTVTQNGTTSAQCGGTVSTCAQTRSFVYDSLSRLKSATNPESGTINYGYDPNGNLTSKTDARGVKTDYIYDALNRVTNRNYSTPNGTPGVGVLANYQPSPNVTYFYDGSNVAGGIANSKGKLTKVASSVSTTEYTEFDILGRVKAHKQTTDGQNYTTGYTYNLSGALLEETYPSGRVVKSTLDQDGDLQQVQSRKANDTFRNYANGFVYAASGAVTSIRLGNGKYESTQFNSRLQPTQISLGSSVGNTNLLKLNYTYNTNGNTDNNGNVLSQTTTVNRSNQSQLVFSQSYVYDSLNRLKSAEETANGSPSWRQTYTFDRYGNRRFDQANTTQPTSFVNPNVTNPTIDPSNNRFTTGQGWVYDLAGNVITDAEGRGFFCDSENKQIEAKNSSSATLGTYYFDGDGKRVKKVVPNGETTIFVYDAGGKLVAEYSTIVQPPSNAKIQYLTNDNLGTPRINTDATGNIVSRSDYMPYGEEIIALGGRSANDKYVADDVRRGFTGYENDGETGLDYAQARMYYKNHGRFTTVDPIRQISPINPQTLNKYVYAINSPYRFVDRKGEWPTEIHNLIFLLSLPGLNKREINRMQDGSYSVDVPTTVLGRYANQHGMCKPSQSPFDCAVGVVNAPTADFLKARGDSLTAHWHFGRASHTLQDIPSPAHSFQVYDDKNFLACSLSLGTNIVACAKYAQEVVDHNKMEEVITQPQLDQLINAQREYYRARFGDDALRKALGIFANARFMFDGPIDGKKLPTVVFDDLGVVTVYPDGREEYNGPLKKEN